MQIEMHTDIASLEAEWDELATRTDAEPWSRPGWIVPWHEAFGRGALEVVALRRDGRLAALASLERRGAALMSPTNWHTPSFDPLAEDADALGELVRGLLSRPSRRLRLGFVAASTVAGVEAAATRRRILSRVLMRSPYLSLEGDMDAYRATLDRVFAKELRRRRRRLAETGDLGFEVAGGGENLEQLLEEGFRVEASGWKGENGTAIVSTPETHRFYTAVARWLAAKGWLGLAFLRVDGEAVAFELTVQTERSTYLLKGGYDESLRRYGPGSLISESLIEHAFERGAESVEFLGSDETFKLNWTRTVRDRHELQAFARNPAGTVEWAAHAYGRPAARRLRALRQRRR